MLQFSHKFTEENVTVEGVDLFFRHAVTPSSSLVLLIHGHTHRQNRHPLTIADTHRERIVLGDWNTQCSILIVEDELIELVNLELDELKSL